MAVTESTTPAKPVRASLARDDKGREQSSLLQLLLILAAAAFLVYLAYPRLQASLIFLPVDTAINQYYDTREYKPEQLEGLQQRAREAIAVYPHYRYWESLSLLYFLQAGDNTQPLFERRQAFDHTIDAAEISLGHAPAQPRTWLRIAQARSWLRYPPEQVIDALKMAIFTGRVEPSMFMTRLTLGLSYLPRMDAEGTAMMRDQVLLAWQFHPRAMTRALRSKTLKFHSVEILLKGGHEGVLGDIRESVDGTVR